MKAYKRRVRMNRALTDCKVYDAATVLYSDDGRRILAGHVKRIIPKRQPMSAESHAKAIETRKRNAAERKLYAMNAATPRIKRTTAADLPSIYNPEDVG